MENKNVIKCFFLGCVTLLFAACEKNGLAERRTAADNTRVMFVHAVPEAVQFNFFVNDVKITGAIVNTSTALPQGMGYNTANQPAYYGYANVTAGNAEIRAITPQKYALAANDTIPAGTAILETDFNIQQDKSYTVLAYGTARAVEELILADELVKESGAAGIRFINLMPGTIPVDLEMTYTPPGSTNPETSLFAVNIAYAGSTGFRSLPPGTYVFQRKRTGTNTLVGSATTITRLNAGQNFTLCARGTLAAMLQIPYQ